MSDAVPMGTGDRILVFLLLLIAGFILLPWKIFILYGIFCVTVALWRLYYERSYFARHGIPSPKGEWIMGHSRVMFKDMMNFDANSFHELGSTYFGAFVFDRKEYTNMDLDFIKDVAVKEFPHFQNRMFMTNNKSKVARKSVMRNLITLKTGEDWKRVRNRITPTFTTGKIKKLIPTFNKCVKDSFRLIDEHIAEGKELDFKKE
ncbi:cytochrome p450 domain-containing protein [Ditylenchus destructor]|nr:cytochrome p450 domain-containing protein [Ditylenchus destructor]